MTTNNPDNIRKCSRSSLMSFFFPLILCQRFAQRSYNCSGCSTLPVFLLSFLVCFYATTFKCFGFASSFHFLKTTLCDLHPTERMAHLDRLPCQDSCPRPSGPVARCCAFRWFTCRASALRPQFLPLPSPPPFFISIKLGKYPVFLFKSLSLLHSVPGFRLSAPRLTTVLSLRHPTATTNTSPRS